MRRKGEREREERRGRRRAINKQLHEFCVQT